MPYEGMREKMARAALTRLWGKDRFDEPEHQRWGLEVADAVLAAMREPTEAMIDAVPVLGRADNNWRHAAARAWKAMIDTASS